MPGATVQIYEIPIGFITGTGSQAVGDVLTMSVSDDDDIFHADEFRDPGAPQSVSVSSGSVSDYQLIRNAMMTYTPAGGPGAVSVEVTILRLTIDGSARYFVMATTGNRIDGLASGSTIARTSNEALVEPDYADLTGGSVPCFTSGTRIATPEGLVEVERLRVDELVETADHGPQPIRWIGRRRLGPDDLIEQPDLVPIRVAAGALGPRLPCCDLVLSPQHRLLLRDWRVELALGEPEILVSAKHLLDHPGVTRETNFREVTYWHIMFERHEIVFAEDFPAESLYLGDQMLDALDGDVQAELLGLFPQLADGTRRAARPFAKAYEVHALA